MERIEGMNLNKYDFLWPEEVKLFKHVLKLNEAAIAFDESEKGRFRDDYFSPYVISVVEHEPWAEKNIPIPEGIKDEVIEIIKAKIASGVYEPSQASYRSRWFCVKKPNGKYRIVHDLQTLNSITIRDSGLPPIMDSFVEQFAGRACYTMADIFVGYDHRTLAKESRDLTSFQTPLGLCRLTSLPMGATNSLPEFHTCVVFIFQDEIPHVAAPFVDDVSVKGAATRYELPDGTYEVLQENPGIRRFIWEHAIDVNRILHRLKCAGGTFAAHKLQIAVPEVKILGQKCTYEGRIPDESKVSAISKWPTPKNLREVRGFLGTCGIVRNWIKGFSEIAAPLVKLTKKDIKFDFTSECQQAMDILKERVISAPAMRPIDYTSDKPIILAVDSSYIAVGWILFQLDNNGQRRPARYGSIAWNERESRYSQPKIELYGLYRAMQKLRPYIVGVNNLIVEMDARYIKGMLNNPDLQPNAAMNRWIFAILLYTFKLVHVPGKKHGPDGLSRRPKADDDESESEDNERWVDHALDALLVTSVYTARIAEDNDWEDDLNKIYKFLSTAESPKDLDEKNKAAFLRKAFKYFAQSGHLWRRSPNGNHRRVPTLKERLDIMETCHRQVGHHGIYSTYQHIVRRYWWPNCYKQVTEFVRACHICQTRSTVKPDVPLTVQHPLGLFRKVHLDAMLMPKKGGYRYILAARCDLSSWLEARMSAKSDSKVWLKFIWEDIICRWGAIEFMVTDNGSEIVKAIRMLGSRYGVNHIRISPYNSRANGVVEKGHYSLRESLVRLCGDDISRWPFFFHAAVWADRITIRRSTGYAPYYLACGLEPSLPLDMIDAALLAPITSEMSTVDLIAARARQLQLKDKTILDVKNRLSWKRIIRKTRYDLEHEASIQEYEFKMGDLVLVRNSKIDKELDRKTKPRWLGPMKIIRQTQGGSYILAELNGAVSKLRYDVKRLVPYHIYNDGKIHITVDPDESEDEN